MPSRFATYLTIVLLALTLVARPARADEPAVRRIALVSDPHTTSTPGQYTRNFARVIEEVNAAGVDAVLLSGDLTQGGSAKDFQEFLLLRKGFHAPSICVPGNHDVGSKIMAGKKPSPNTPSPITVERLQKYQDALGDPFFSSEVIPGIRVVGICASLFDSGLDQEATQWTFLETELARPYAGTTLLLTHYPPFIKQADESDQYFNMSVGPRGRLLKLLSAANVKTVLSGHLHYPREWHHDGVHLISAPAVSFGLPQGVQGVGWTLVTVAADGACTAEVKYLPKEPAPAATRPAVEGNPSSGRIDLFGLGDWGSNNPEQRKVAAAMADYAERSADPFAATLLLGDNFYIAVRDVNDRHWNSVFEKVYDPKRLAMPFYAILGNHDYEQAPDAAQTKAEIELEYAKLHPESRWKMPAQWYRLDFPAKDPVVSVLMLNSVRQNLSDEDWNEQTRWLEEQLARPRNGAWMVVSAHHNIFNNGHHGDNGVLESTWGPLLKKYNVDFYLCGHEHSMQHLELPDWPLSFVISGGGGAGLRPMIRDNRGPFSQATFGFAHLTFTPDQAIIRLLDEDSKPLHIFHRDRRGKVTIDYTLPSDRATTNPLRAIQGLPADR